MDLFRRYMELGDSPRSPLPPGHGPRPAELPLSCAIKLCLTEGSTVEDALRLSELQARYPLLMLELAPVGVWGTLCERSHALRDKDRVEVYRALLVDPKDARRRRQRAQVKKRG
jgi:putative ubiquitin-RnfH superfamily antitoxin RatB of RatAB toxin-antitoxin module